MRWRDAAARRPARPGKSPLAARLVLDDGRGLRPHRGGHQEAAWRSTSCATPHDVPGIARLGPDPLADDFTVEVLAAILARGRAGADQGRAARPVGHRRDRQRLLRRDPARGEDVAVQAGGDAATRRAARCTTRSRRRCARRSSAPTGWPPSELKEEKKSGLRVHGRTGEACPVCGDTVRRGVVRRLVAAVLPDLPDRRQAARRPPDVPAAEVTAASGSRRPPGRLVR